MRAAHRVTRAEHRTPFVRNGNMTVTGPSCSTLAAMAAKGLTSVHQSWRVRLKAFGRLVVCTCTCVLPVFLPAQSSQPAKPAAANGPQDSARVASALQPSVAQPAGLHSVVTLDGPWRFQIGDDPQWSDPAYDDSNWTAISLSKPLSEQGISTYAGFAWYRMHLHPSQLTALDFGAAQNPQELLVSPNSIGQLALYVNGLQTGRTTGMADALSAYQSPPFISSLSSPAPDGSCVFAIRTWAPDSIPIRQGLLSRVELGSPSDIAARRDVALVRKWTDSALAALAISFLFLCVAILGAALFLAQRSHTEYLWLAILSLTVAISGTAEALYGLGRVPLNVYQDFSRFSSHIFMIVTLEFVLRFTASNWRRTVRGAQIAFLLLPFLAFLPMQQIYNVLSVAAEVAFCALACIMLFRAWRSGLRDAGVMLIPFLLATTAGSTGSVLDYFASIHWLPATFASHAFHLGPVVYGIGSISYTVFLFSLVAVILYRFIRVSQQEQRSTAEISAARSVQALLIPTQLPRSRHFVLESAYLPAQGVGGDFFQALPLHDDSLLLVVGDVSGKGLQAAMNSSTLVGALRNELSNDPATILAHLNNVLIGAVAVPGAVPDLDVAPCFATCLCARIYPDGSMTIANAGHLSPYREGHEVEIEPSLPLGVIAGAEYVQTKHTLAQGDRLVFISDGVIEAASAEGELFGFDRTRQVSNESARYIAQTAKHFGQTDDITVVSLYVASTQPLPQSRADSTARTLDDALESA